MTIGWPAPLRLVSDEFGPREAPVPGASTFHRGIDFGMDGGAPIPCAEDGTVVWAGSNGGEGISVHVQHDDGHTLTKYFHAKALAGGIYKGQRVRRGQTLSYVGSTGTSGGNHLHFETHVNGVATNPRTLIREDSFAWIPYTSTTPAGGTTAPINNQEDNEMDSTQATQLRNADANSYSARVDAGAAKDEARNAGSVAAEARELARSARDEARAANGNAVAALGKLDAILSKLT